MDKNPLFHNWLQKADEDYQFASINLTEEKTFFSQICFHYHQAAEKYLKSFIVAYNLPFRKIHNLKELVNICREKDPSFSQIEEACIYLNQYYIETRYPVHWPTALTQKDAETAKENAAHISSFIKAKLQ